MIEGEGAGKGDTYRAVVWKQYRRNFDRALCTKTIIGICTICKSDILKYDSEDYSETFCSNSECINHTKYSEK